MHSAISGKFNVKSKLLWDRMCLGGWAKQLCTRVHGDICRQLCKQDPVEFDSVLVGKMGAWRKQGQSKGIYFKEVKQWTSELDEIAVVSALDKNNSRSFVSCPASYQERVWEFIKGAEQTGDIRIVDEYGQIVGLRPCRRPKMLVSHRGVSPQVDFLLFAVAACNLCRVGCACVHLRYVMFRRKF